MTKHKNHLYYGDNLDVMRKYIKDETIDLSYIDPPFNSKRNYNQIYNNVGSEDRAQAQAFVDTWVWDTIAEHGLSEICENKGGVFTKQSIELIIGLLKVLGKGSLMAYLVSMTLRIAEIHRVLKPNGSFFFHCDPTASHYLKLVLDAIFCPKGGEIRNEIIWCYTGPGSPGMRQFMRKHDVIFWYCKSDTWIFNRDDVRIPHSKKTKENYKAGLVGSGFVEADHVIHEKGKVPEDWWEMAIAPRGKEYLGYPTQKPEQLLERIIKACTNVGDVVFDAYSGCGTSISVSERLGRKWIGIDITYHSISLILKRLTDTYGKIILDTVNLVGIPKDIESAIALANKRDDRVRKEFEKWCVLTYSENTAIINEKKGGDGGVDGISFLLDKDTTTGENVYKQVIFSVKSDKTIVPAYVRDLYGTVTREGAVMGILIVLYPKESIVKESKKYGLYTNNLFNKDYPTIQIVSVEEILKGERVIIPTTNRIEVVKGAEKATELDKDQIKMEL